VAWHTPAGVAQAGRFHSTEHAAATVAWRGLPPAISLSLHGRPRAAHPVGR
jgi:hypothetical protein